MDYRKLPIWENRRRLELLADFRTKFIEYVNDLEFAAYGDGPIEGNTARQRRGEINLILRDVQYAVRDAGCYSQIQYQDAPIVGGRRYNLDPIANLFNLHRFEMEPTFVTDPVEHAMGVYAKDQASAWIRTLNPIWWIWQAISWIAALPFALLAGVGFSKSRLEDSLLGRIYRVAAELVLLSATMLQIDQIAFDGSLLSWARVLVSVLGS